MIDPIKLHAYADGQLDPQEAAEVKAKLAHCTRSSAELNAILGVKKTLQALDAVTCEKTWMACQARVIELEKSQRIEGFVGKYAWGICGAFLAMIVVGGTISRSANAGVRTSDLPGLASGLSPFAGPATKEPGVVQRWLSDVAPEANAANGRMEILGGAMGQIDGHPVTRLNLRDEQGSLTLFVIRGVDHIDGVQIADSGDHGFGLLSDMRCVTWQNGSATMLLVGDRPFENLWSTVASYHLR